MAGGGTDIGNTYGNTFELKMNNTSPNYSIKLLTKPQQATLFPQLQKIANCSRYTHLNQGDLHRIFAVWNAKRIVGFAGLTCYHSYWGLRLCVVLPEHRGFGLQRRLIDTRIRYIRRIAPQQKHLSVWVSPKNKYSLRNLLKVGFKPNGETKSYSGIPCIKLRLNLAKK